MKEMSLMSWKAAVNAWWHFLGFFFFDKHTVSSIDKINEFCAGH